MSKFDRDSLLYGFLWDFSMSLHRKASETKTEKTESLLLREFAEALTKSILDPSAWCSIPNAYEHPSEYARHEFIDYLNNQIKKYSNEKGKETEFQIAQNTLDKFHHLYGKHEDEVHEALMKHKAQMQLGNTEIKSTHDIPISFYRAANILAEKLNTPVETIEHELVGWICGEICVVTPTGKNHLVRRDLRAYTSKTLDPNHQFDSYPYSDLSINNDFEYLAYFQGCYFSLSDIENFNPVERYITGYALIERWLGYCGSELGVKAKVISCGNDERLYWFHPFCLSTTGAPLPNAPFGKHLFCLREVECVEREDFFTVKKENREGDNPATPETARPLDGGEEPTPNLESETTWLGLTPAERRKIAWVTRKKTSSNDLAAKAIKERFHLPTLGGERVRQLVEEYNTSNPPCDLPQPPL